MHAEMDLIKARNAFSILNNVKLILLYGAEILRYVRIDFNKLNIFHTKSLMRI